MKPLASVMKDDFEWSLLMGIATLNPSYGLIKEQPMYRYLTSIMFFVLSASASATEFSRVDVCKATIAIEMGRDNAVMKTEESGDSPVVSYIRSDDLQKFTYRCKFNGYQVIWSTYFDDEGQWGRWRDDPAFDDAKTTFETRGNELVLKNSQLGEKVFTRKSF